MFVITTTSVCVPSILICVEHVTSYIAARSTSQCALNYSERDTETKIVQCNAAKMCDEVLIFAHFIAFDMFFLTLEIS